MTAATLVRVGADDSTAPTDQDILDARWADADRDVESARRHVEVAVGTLWRLLPRRLDDPAAWVGRWAREIVLDLDELDRVRELPGGAR